MPAKKVKRLRMFGGPNGSGKSSVLRNIDRHYHIGYYINADEIENLLKNQGFLNLSNYGILLEKGELKKFIKKSSFFQKTINTGLDISLRVEENVVVANPNNTHSYEAALISSFLREKLISLEKSLSFETVMSHPSKLDILKLANHKNYRNYLYFICTQSPALNVERVRHRVEKGGHPVPEDKIVSRYHRSLDLLSAAIKETRRAFIFDNSKHIHELILEVFNGNEIVLHTDTVPKWVQVYVIDRL